ncbi:MAG: hypothetical protein AAF938_29665 [Myxococcota bacterium]
MDALLTPTHLTLRFTALERLLAVRFERELRIPREQIVDVGEGEGLSWKTIRAPGTAVPGVIVAGTYYTKGRREFHYRTGRQPSICLTLVGHRFSRVCIDRRYLDRGIIAALNEDAMKSAA